MTSTLLNRYFIGDVYRVKASRKSRKLVPRGSEQEQHPQKINSQPEKDTSSHLEILQKIIPGESISVYFLAQSLSSSASNPERFMKIGAVITVLMAALLRIFLTQDTKALNPWKTIQWPVVITSTIGAIIWIYAIGGSLFVGEEILDIQLYAQILGFVFAVLAPIIARQEF